MKVREANLEDQSEFAVIQYLAILSLGEKDSGKSTFRSWLLTFSWQ